MNDLVIQTRYRDCTLYHQKDGIYIYRKGILVCFSNKMGNKYHQIFITGKYTKRTRYAIYALLSYTFDNIALSDIDTLLLGDYILKPYNYKGGAGKCFMNPYQ